MLLVLCLLVMQAQLWAAGALGCRHEAGAKSVATAACPVHDHSSPSPDPTHPARVLDCQKCVLHLAVGAPALGGSAPTLPALLGGALPSAFGERHFYHFTPDSRHRPPIA
jgi:hypothetical protein